MVIIRLQPPGGVPPLLIGMSIDEARNAMTLWGNPEEVLAAPGEMPQLRVRDEDLTRDIFAHMDGDGKVSAIEVWKPVPSKHQGEAVHVLYGEVEIFTSAASDVIRFLRD